MDVSNGSATVERSAGNASHRTDEALARTCRAGWCGDHGRCRRPGEPRWELVWSGDQGHRGPRSLERHIRSRSHLWYAGNDSLHGFAGKDTHCGWTRNRSPFRGPGNDLLARDALTDRVMCGVGSDSVADVRDRISGDCEQVSAAGKGAASEPAAASATELGRAR